MFIQCSDCDYKYIVNSADLKPDGRMVECANCNHRWFQELLKGEDLLSSSVPRTPQEKSHEKQKTIQNDETNSQPEEIKNLPSTVVREKKVSYLNTFLVIFFLVLVFFLFWTLRSYGTNIFVLVSFYINEFFFNLKLIIDDLAKIIYQIVN
ncbi:zinc-ribbon domain-containing protein [Pelagibacterales bacterium SAG-MED31]|nr:zinc-ribbon domain-containing protein [Pelagibacterales bacterium SAG-MED31]